MYNVTYYKFGNRWFLDLPEYIERGGDPDDLERIGAFHDFLEIIAGDKGTVNFLMDNQPFEGADYFELVGSSGGNSGGYYRAHFFNGEPMEMELWFNTLLYFSSSEMPEKIYFKKI